MKFADLTAAELKSMLAECPKLREFLDALGKGKSGRATAATNSRSKGAKLGVD